MSAVAIAQRDRLVPGFHRQSIKDGGGLLLSVYSAPGQSMRVGQFLLNPVSRVRALTRAAGFREW